MRERFMRFMAGRYGSDQLSRFTMGVALVFMIVYMITRWQPLYLITMILLMLNIFRMFSRNVSARYAENNKYLALKDRVTGFIRGTSRGDAQHRIYRCPKCGQKVRVPRGRGRIAITCPKCRAEFIKKT